jgi:uncharacterized protein YceH (UPF0502 family)
MQSLHEADSKVEAQAREQAAHAERADMAAEIRALRADVAALHTLLEARRGE